MMTPLHPEYETAEIRLLRCIQDLNARVLAADSPAARDSLRETIEVFRGELLKLVKALPVYTEDDIACLRQLRSGHPAPATLLQPS